MHRRRGITGVVCVLLVAALIFGVLGQPVVVSANRPHWAQEYVDILYNADVLQEHDFEVRAPIIASDFSRWISGIFRQSMDIYVYSGAMTRLDGLMLAAEAFRIPAGDMTVLSMFLDYYLVPEDYRPRLAGLVEAGIIRGHTSGNLDPHGFLTRGQGAALLALSAGQIFFEAGKFSGLVIERGVINIGGVVLKDVEVSGNLIITGQGEPIIITGNFGQVIVDTDTLVVINGFVGELIVLAEKANIEMDNAEISNIQIYGSMLDGEDESVYAIPTPMPLSLQTPTPVPTAAPVPTATPDTMPTPTPMPIPTPAPDTGTGDDGSDENNSGSAPITVPGDEIVIEPGAIRIPISEEESILLTSVDPEYQILGQLFDHIDEIVVEEGRITGIYIQSTASVMLTNLNQNPEEILEIHLGQDTNIVVSYIYDMHNLVIVGTGDNAVTLTQRSTFTNPPPSSVMSVSGDIVLQLANPGLFFDLFTINLVGQVNLQLGALSVLGMTFDLSRLCYDYASYIYLGSHNIQLIIPGPIHNYVINIRHNAGGVPLQFMVDHSSEPYHTESLPPGFVGRLEYGGLIS
ncbi:MAG: S-layer homology domain-containing protein [Defluviitaleaceae bacterium]|nr:S-layer homology domain-containing protein [Defluviitaleaceae bacterium]